MTAVTLIATLGRKAQIITLALDCLAEQGAHPDELIIAHTQRNRPETAAALARLHADLPLTYPSLTIHLLELADENGPLNDVTTPAEVEVAFRRLYAAVRAVKLQDRVVHLLIAGGRRTLVVFGMATAQLLFGAEDRLWHLASHPALEASGALHAGPGEWARLIPIPVVIWGQLSPAFEALAEVDDPFIAVERLQALKLREQWDEARIFILTYLTPAERKVAELLTREGLDSAEIARRRGVEKSTVDKQLESIFHKAAAHWGLASVSRTRLVALLSVYFKLRVEDGEKYG